MAVGVTSGFWDDLAGFDECTCLVGKPAADKQLVCSLNRLPR
jgi:hypothetical protein